MRYHGSEHVSERSAVRARSHIAAFMIALILSLPIVTAQSLDVTQFSGSQNIPNIAKSVDTLTVKAKLSIPGDAEITGNQMRIANEGGVVYFAESCESTSESGVYECTFHTDIAGPAGQQAFAVMLYDDDGSFVQGKLEVLTNDDVDPDLLSFSAAPEIVGATTTLSYHAQDFAVVTGDTSTCAGIGSLRVYENSLSNPPTVIPVTPSCDVTSTVSYVPKATGEVHLCAIAVDRIGRTSAPECQDINVDRSGPDFKGFRVLSQDGVQIFSIPPTGTVANVEIDVDDVSLDPNSVRADFGSLANNPLYNDRAPVSITPDNPHVLTWMNVPINTVSPCALSVRASDTLGNTGSKAFTCNIVSDVSPPNVVSAGTGFTTADGTILLGKQGTFTVTFNEAGLARGNALLDASGLGLGSVRASKCAQSGTNWLCSWNLPGSVASGTYTLTVQADTTDDVGNRLGEARPFTVVYDAEPPVLRDEPVVIKVYHTAADYGDQAVKGDVVALTYAVDGATSVVADMTGVGGEKITQGSCETVDEKTTCTIQQDILNSGPYAAKIPVSLLDEAGNHADAVYDLQVFGLKSETDPNHWTSAVSCTPDVIDRSTSAYVNNQVYCHVKLSSPNDGVAVANVAMGPLEECTGDLAASVSDISVMNGQSTDPFVRVLLTTREYPEKSASLTCPVHILTKVGDEFLDSPEVEQVPITVQFGLGQQASMAQAIDSKVNDAVDEAESLSKWLKTANLFVQYADKICMLRTVIWDVLAALETVVAIVGVVQQALKYAFDLGDAIKPEYTAICNVKEYAQKVFSGAVGESTASSASSLGSGIDSVLKPFCQYMNCQTLDAVGSIAGGSLVNDQQTAANIQGAGQVVDKIWANPKESIVSSIAQLCIPGLIYNVDKYRQIQCRYAVCLKRDVADAGVPLSVCDDDKAYMTCLLVWNQAFTAIPFASLAEQYVNQLKDILSNPFAALATLVGAACGESFCEQDGPLYTICSAAKLFNVVGTVINDFNTVKQPGFWSVGQGACEELEGLD